MNKEYVWYVCYGSNIFTERFMAYLKGNKIPGTSIEEMGCRDRTDPVKIEKYLLPYQMFFAGKSKRWNMQGVGFVCDKADFTYTTYGKRYLITRDQFLDIVCQENKVPLSELDNMTLPIFSERGSYVLFSDKSYGKVMLIDIEDEIPILTFTSVNETPETAVTPSIEYLNMIALGIHETHNISKRELVDYFGGLCGIKGYYTKEYLYQMITSIS